MKANELRVGNLVIVPNNVISYVEGIKRNNAQSSEISTFFSAKEKQLVFINIDTIRPITLDEEWLLKFGFQAFPWGWVKKSKKDFGIRLNIKTYSYEVDGNSSVKLEYVHQLQNLYFILTGEELEVSQIEYA